MQAGKEGWPGRLGHGLLKQLLPKEFEFKSVQWTRRTHIRMGQEHTNRPLSECENGIRKRWDTTITTARDFENGKMGEAVKQV